MFMFEYVCIHEYVYITCACAPSLYVCMYIYTDVCTYKALMSIIKGVGPAQSSLLRSE